MKTAGRHSTIHFLARATRQLLLLTLLLSSVALGGAIDHVPQSGKLDSLPSQLNLVDSDHAALLGQQDTLRAIKRLDSDDSADSPWLLASTVIAISLPSYTATLRARYSAIDATSVLSLSHTPRAPPVLS